jgi:hypothetical protein
MRRPSGKRDIGAQITSNGQDQRQSDSNHGPERKAFHLIRPFLVFLQLASIG